MPVNISETFLETTFREFRVLLAIENKMKSYEWVPAGEICNFTDYGTKETEYILFRLAKNKLVQRNVSGYRIYFEAYDLLALNAFVKRNSVNAIGNPIGAGKESRIYEATSGLTGRPVVIKFHREGKMGFRQVAVKRGHLGERKHISWLYASRLAAKREYDVMSKLYPEVSVPEPVDYNRHAIVMSPVKGPALAHTRVDEPEWYLDEILNQIGKAFRLGIIHGDLNEYNVFVNPGGCEIIDWPQHTDFAHPNARELLCRDIENILNFFMRRYRIERDIQETMNRIYA
ncbi:MAG TPA: RIO1 family regulatory kinase/ATPase [Candidatus Methanoperedens sp.]